MHTTEHFIELAKKKLTAWHAERTTNAQVSARDLVHVVMERLSRATKQPTDTADNVDVCTLPPLTVDELNGLSLFIPFLDMTIACRDEIYSIITYNLMRFLGHPQSIEYITSQPGGERALAYFVCYVGMSYVYDTSMYADEEQMVQANMRRLLEVWTQEPVKDDIPVDMKTAVSMLYGPACWDLYDCTNGNTNNFILLYQTLYALADAGLPLVFKKNITALESPTHLPGNMVS